MALQFESIQVINKPIDKVFQFYAVEHVRNHPRWDSDIELWLDDETAPLGVGTIIHRINKRSGKPVEGTMKVIEFESNRVFAMEVHDGSALMFGRSTFEKLGPNKTKLSVVIDIPWMDANADKTFLNNRLESSARLREQLMNAEIENE
jgi:hypothetical protein